MYTDNYVVKSLELHLFFGRIMKEHSFFLKAGFAPADADFSRRATFFMNEFEDLLSRAVTLANGTVSSEVLSSGEVMTEFTAPAERKTRRLTGISINTRLTERTARINCADGQRTDFSSRQWQVQRLNRRALTLLNGLIELKESILNNVLNCRMFTMNYPLLIEHILREAKLNRQYVRTLEREGDLTVESMREVENFWNRIMMEHTMFIRGLLDPCETELFDTADGLAKEFCELLEASRNAQDKTLTEISLEKTVKLRDFKQAGTQGIQECRIRSIILPLLADHVLREANHYIRLLQC